MKKHIIVRKLVDFKIKDTRKRVDKRYLGCRTVEVESKKVGLKDSDFKNRIYI